MTMNVINHNVEDVDINRGKTSDGNLIQDSSTVNIPAFFESAYVTKFALCFCPCVNDATYVAPNQQFWTEITWNVQVKHVSQNWGDQDIRSSTTGPTAFYIYHDQPCRSNAPNLVMLFDDFNEFAVHHFDIRVQSIIIKADDIDGQDTYPDGQVQVSDYTMSNINFNYLGGQ
jgi:hypothetical protein